MPNLSLTEPSRTKLHQFLLGQLEDAEMDHVERWLADDDSRARCLEDIPAADSFVSGLIRTPPPPCTTPSVESVVRRVLHALHADRTRPQPPMPEQIGGYRILGVLGRGGMGVVYEAQDGHLGRRVALKVLNAELVLTAEGRARFHSEAVTVANLRSDHIVAVYKGGEDNGVPYLVMERLEGETLEAFLRRRSPLPVSEVVRIAREILEGLAVAHASGVVHRDIKPQNLWIEANTQRVKILDFGLTRNETTSTARTRPGTVLGTAAYMAPEQADGKKIDARADLFSVGVVLYRMLAGQSPFERSTIPATLHAVVHNDVPALPASVPAGLSGFIARLLAKSPADRPPNARTAIAELDRALLQTAPTPPPPRRAGWLGAALALILAGVGLAALLAWVVAPSKADRELAAMVDEMRQPEKRTLEMTQRFLDFLRRHAGTPAALRAWEEIQALPSYLDRLAADGVLEPERLPVDGIVGVIGTQAGRTGLLGENPGLAFRPDGKQFAVNDPPQLFSVPQRRWQATLPTKATASVYSADGRLLLTTAGIHDIQVTPPRLVLKADKLDERLRTAVGLYVATESKDLVSVGERGVDVWRWSGTEIVHRHALAKAQFPALSPGGTVLAVMTDGQVKLFDLTADPIKEAGTIPDLRYVDLKVPTNFQVLQLVSDSRLLTVEPDRRARLWDITRKPARAVAEIARADLPGRTIAEGSGPWLLWDRSVAVQEVRDDRFVNRGSLQLPTLPGNQVQRASVTGDGGTLATLGADGVVRLWDLTGEKVAEIDPVVQPGPGAGALTSDGHYLIAPDDFGQVRIWDLGHRAPRIVETGTDFGRPAQHGWNQWTALLLHPSNEYLGITWYDRAGFWSLPPAVVKRSTWQPDGTPFYARSGRLFLSKGSSFAAYDTTQSPPRLLWYQDEKPGWVEAASDDGSVLITRRLVPGDGVRSFDFWTTTEQGATLRGSLPGTKNHVIVLTPDGKRAFAAGLHGDPPLSLYDLDAGKPGQGVTFTPIQNDRLTSLRIAPGGRQLVVTTRNGQVVLIDTTTREVTKRWQFPRELTHCEAAVDGRHLIVWSAGGPIYILRHSERKP